MYSSSSSVSSAKYFTYPSIAVGKRVWLHQTPLKFNSHGFGDVDLKADLLTKQVDFGQEWSTKTDGLLERNGPS